MKTYVTSALFAMAVCGFVACGVEQAPVENAGQVEQAATNCEACFFEWSYCDDNCTPECTGVEDWSACFNQCEERCWNDYYRCFGSCAM